jgi:NIPSNAP protein
LIFELRQYTLHPGRRDELIDLFDREFIDTQEACGISVLGQFRDLDDSDRFVWFRGFADMVSRRKALYDFYTGPTWKAHRTAANATMVDVSDVRLLRPAAPHTGLSKSEAGSPESVILATIYSRDEPFDEAFLADFDRVVRPALPAEPLACLQTEHSENTYPALPVRAGENVFVFLARFKNLSQLESWHHPTEISLARQELRLTPTANSRLR